MSQNQPQTRRLFDGGIEGKHLTGWPEGVDSFTVALGGRPSQIRWLVNGVVRGGLVQTRPGYKRQLNFDVTDESKPYKAWWDGAGNPVLHPQMCRFFRPTYGNPQLVFAVSGSVWHAEVNADGSIEDAVLIESLHFSAFADQIIGCPCVQTATIASGLYANNIVPTNLLMLQDGINRAGIWDGLGGRHANPQKMITTDADGNTFYTNGWNETRIGFWMAWSGNRLFVFNGNQGFASDLGDPTHFTEELTLTSFPVFTFPSDVTGAIDRGTSGTNQSQVIVTVRDQVWALWSGLQARIPSANAVGWANTPDFCRKIFDGVGCVAGKSLVVHRGLLYWLSEYGVVCFDSTNTVFSTQNLPPIDDEIAYSKRRMAPNPASVCAGAFSSYVFWSVPVGQVTNGRIYNYHTQVLDRQTTIVRTLGIYGPLSYSTSGWQGVWTGIRPVEWALADVGGTQHPYALSMDADGFIRIYEAFQGNRCDDGNPIPWMIETHTSLLADTVFDLVTMKHFRLLFSEIIGNLSVRGSWRGLRGAYHELLNTTVTATPGSLFTPVDPYAAITNDSPSEGFATQGRELVSQNNLALEVGGSRGVESPYADSIDRGFGLKLDLVGRGALMAYRIAGDLFQQTREGEVAAPESGFNIVPEIGDPEHIDGATPDYLLNDTNQRESLVASKPRFTEDDTYQAGA